MPGSERLDSKPDPEKRIDSVEEGKTDSVETIPPMRVAERTGN
ncbi:MAG: hypothetical protein SCJ97_05210 [Bacillota bacterium]|nr:hypothetical protein [Bacillota bacterium]